MADTSRGKSVRCSYCNADIFVPRVFRTRQVSDNDPQGVVWIRATCACGKVIKAPEEWLGKVGKCPKCRRDLALLDMLAGEEPAPGANEQVAPEVETPSEEESIRRDKAARAAKPAASPAATAPAVSSASTPASPPVTRPARPESPAKPATPLPKSPTALSGKPPEESGTGSVSGLLDLSNAKDVPLVDELAEDPESRANLHLGRHVTPPGGSVDAEPSPEPMTAEPPRSLRQKIMVDLAVIPYSVALVLAVLSGWNIYRFMEKGNPKDMGRWTAPVVPVYFYDLGTGKAFVQSSNVIPPIEPPSKFTAADDTPGGVRVYLFACGSCKSPENATIGFAESFTKQGQAAAESMNEALATGQSSDAMREAESQMFTGRLIGQVDGQNTKWDPAESSMAAVRLTRLNRLCEDGKPQVLCIPPNDKK